MRSTRSAYRVVKNSAQKPYLNTFSSHKNKISGKMQQDFWKKKQDFWEDIKEKSKTRNFMDATL